MTRTVNADGSTPIKHESRSDSIAKLLVRFSVFVTLAAISCTIAGFLGRLHWFLELFSHFRSQYTVALLLVLPVPLLLRRWKASWFVAATAALFVGSLIPMWSRVDTLMPGERSSIRVAMWNVRTANRRHDEVIGFLQRTDADIILILEIDDRWLRALRDGLPEYSHTATDPRDDNFGIGLFSRMPFEGGAKAMGAAGLPGVQATFRTEGATFEFIGVHTLPPRNGSYASYRNDMFQTLIKTIPGIESPVLLFGDLNVTPWSPYFVDLLDGTGLVDGRHGYGLRPTWRASWGPLGILIDHCLVSPDVGVEALEVGPGGGSDHRAVVVDLTIPIRKERAGQTP